jgi:hypothetical protein
MGWHFCVAYLTSKYNSILFCGISSVMDKFPDIFFHLSTECIDIE